MIEVANSTNFSGLNYLQIEQISSIGHHKIVARMFQKHLKQICKTWRQSVLQHCWNWAKVLQVQRAFSQSHSYAKSCIQFLISWQHILPVNHHMLLWKLYSLTEHFELIQNIQKCSHNCHFSIELGGKYNQPSINLVEWLIRRKGAGTIPL